MYAAQGAFRAKRYDSQLKEALERYRELLLKNTLAFSLTKEFLQGFGEAMMLGSELEFMETEWRRSFPSLDANYFQKVGNLYQRIGISLLESSNDPIEAKRWLMGAALYHSSALSNRERLFELGKDWYFLGEVYRLTEDTTRALINFYRALVLAATLKSPETVLPA